MHVDVAGAIGAMVREVRSAERDGQPVKVLVAARTYDTTAEDLWDAFTSPERIPRWFLPISGDLRLGGRYQFQGNAGGLVEACEPPRRLAVTWEFGGGVSWVVLTLAAAPGGGTTLELEHTAPVPPEMWARFGPGAVGVGWELGLMGLGLHLASGEANDPAAVAAWSASEDGKSFVRASSQGWARAAVAGGEDAASAAAGEAETTAFYTGAPPPGAT